MTKSELRKSYLEKRSALTPDECSEASRSIAERFFHTYDLATVKTLHCFIPIARFNEIDTSLIYERVWRKLPQIRTTAPRVDAKSGEIQNLVFSSDTELTANAWGIREPGHGDVVDAMEIDLVIVPLLCFDKSGHRVGYGKGFYDKLLSRCRLDCLKIGVSYFAPIDRIVEVGPHDVPIDACITPREVFEFSMAKDADPR